MTNTLKTLNLDGFEKLSGELRNLKKINLLVGPNGSGKSSVLRLLHKHRAKTPNDPDRRNGSLAAAASLLFDLDYDVHAIDPSTKAAFNLEGFREINYLFPGAEIEKTILSEPYFFVNGNKEIKGTETRTIELIGGVELQTFAQNAPGGWRSFTKIVSELNNTIEKQKKTGAGNPPKAFAIVLIEEPETGLHPTIQKQFLKELNERLQNFTKAVQCFVTTHSPYIVGSAAELNDCQVYLLSDCKPSDVKGSVDSAQSGSGYSGQEALLAAHHLLGSGISDFIPDLIFCENSVYVLLDAIATRGGPKIPTSIQTVSGDSDAISKTNAMAHLFETLSILVKGNGPTSLFVPSVIAAVLDGPLDQGTQKSVDLLRKKRKLKICHFGTSEELEANYPPALVKSFFENHQFKFTAGEPITRLLAEAASSITFSKGVHAWVGEQKSLLAEHVTKNASAEEFEALSESARKLYSCVRAKNG